jgi:positive regulator of sigma E activity
MRTLEIIVALIFALIVFVAIKLIGLVLHIALIGAALGLIAGFLIARVFRRS